VGWYVTLNTSRHLGYLSKDINTVSRHTKLRICLYVTPSVLMRTTMLVLAPRQLTPRVGLSCCSIIRAHFSSASSSLSPLPPPPSASQNSGELLPRTIASLLHPASQISKGGQPDDCVAENVTIHGWIKSIRRMGKICFAHITDGSTSLPLQAVLTKLQAAG
jgi:asparaginyl-tRNA synthetase